MATNARIINQELSIINQGEYPCKPKAAMSYSESQAGPFVLPAFPAQQAV
ncbi:MAG: hypothetical protein OXU61_11400 [Gammaproteobacteria bacterium]|nr:hypothetical protein [Gammaproteobacteria bacterium]